MKVIFASLIFLGASAFAIEPGRCPESIQLQIHSVKARVHAEFKKDAAYAESVAKLNDLSQALVVYHLHKRGEKSCEYRTVSQSALYGYADLYTKTVYSPEDPPTDVDYLRTSFFAKKGGPKFALSLPVAEYGSNSIKVEHRDGEARTLLVLLTDKKSGKAWYRRSGLMRLSVSGSRL
ncbi:MAG: hypothetical protein AB7F86_04910 [Bdellovibrionales bacterium]